MAAGRYTHWGYGDMDMLMGRLFLPSVPSNSHRAAAQEQEQEQGSRPFHPGRGEEQHPFAVDPEDLDSFDLLTFSFGDQFRGYLR